MKPSLLIPLFLLAAALPAEAWPFTGRSVTGGFSHADNWSIHSRDAVCADFAGNGQRQWYFGGETIKAFPGTVTRTLPAISLASHPTATARPLSHALLDVDRDGDMDIVRVVDWNTSHLLTIQVYLNQGGGTYTIGYRRDWTENPGFNTGDHVMQIVGGDFDRDGSEDLAVLTMYEFYDISQNSYQARGYPSIWWNDGTGQLNTITTLDGRGYSRNSNMTVGDVDRDGDVDLVCSDWSYKDSNDVWHDFVRTYTNDGTGAFTISSVGRTRWNLGLIDVNRDGWLDLMSVDTSGPVVALNDRAGTFPAGTNTGSSATMYYAIGDVDEDGIPDMICAGAGSVTTVVFRKGTGGGSFLPAQTLYTLSAEISGLAVADAEPDGDMDIMVSTWSGAFVLLENRSPHRSPAGGTVSTASLAGVTQLTTGDFNRDGLQDVLAVTPSQEKVWFFNGETDGVPAVPVFKLTQNEAPARVAVADFNRDGRDDFAYTLPAPGEVRQVLNNGNAAPALWPDTSVATIPGVSLITTGQHGTPNSYTDLLISSGTTGSVRWLHQTGSAWNPQTVVSTFNPAPGSLAAVNSTARPGDEVFFTAVNAGTVRVRGMQLNPDWVTAGDFTQSVTVSPSSAAMTWADLEPGGRQEAVFVTGAGKVAYWTPANNSTTVTLLGTPAGTVRAMTPVDWNRDGRTDILCATSTGLELFYKPEYSWLRRTLTTEAAGFDSVVTVDLNRDGLMDAAAGSTTGGKVAFIKNYSSILEVAVQETSTVQVAGSAANVITAAVTHAGHDPAIFTDAQYDMPVAAKRAVVRFTRALQSGDDWVEGTALTSTEFSQLVTGVSLMVNGTVVGSTGPADYEANGNLSIAYNAVLGNLVPVTTGATVPLTLRLTATAGAGSGSIQRFFVRLPYLEVETQDGRSLTETALFTPLAGASLVQVVPQYTALQQWRITNFGSPNNSGAGANDADPDVDGNPNIVEYIMGQNPKSAAAGVGDPRPLILTTQGLNAPALADLRLLTNYDSKVRLFIQKSTNLQNWQTLGWRDGGAGTWYLATPAATSLSGGRTRYVFDTGAVPATTPKFYVRLRAQEMP